MRFLVVDDSATMRRIIVNSLARIGHDDVLEAEDGVAALAAFDLGGIQFIITDWNMPQMSGLDLARRVRGVHRRDSTGRRARASVDAARRHAAQMKSPARGGAFHEAGSVVSA